MIPDRVQQFIKLFPGFDVVINGLPWKYDLPGTQACVEAGAGNPYM